MLNLNGPKTGNTYDAQKRFAFMWGIRLGAFGGAAIGIIAGLIVAMCIFRSSSAKLPYAAVAATSFAAPSETTRYAASVSGPDFATDETPDNATYASDSDAPQAAVPVGTMEEPISALKIGQFGWVTPWAMTVDAKHHCWLDPSFPMEEEAMGTCCMKVTRKSDGYHVEYSREAGNLDDYKWDSEPAPADSVPVRRFVID